MLWFPLLAVWIHSPAQSTETITFDFMANWPEQSKWLCLLPVHSVVIKASPGLVHLLPVFFLRHQPLKQSACFRPGVVSVTDTVDNLMRIKYQNKPKLVYISVTKMTCIFTPLLPIQECIINCLNLKKCQNRNSKRRKYPVGLCYESKGVGLLAGAAVWGEWL